MCILLLYTDRIIGIRSINMCNDNLYYVYDGVHVKTSLHCMS